MCTDNRIYWTNALNSQIYVSDLAGSYISQLTTANSNDRKYGAYGIVADGYKVYFSDIYKRY